ncbi:uncharacterized protein LOC106398556 [Brassica napus]|uniref:uncharacterized protein LOC106398556 n=1 Tax=Brassica napus TaxID=3708 RepID=UPI0020793165|nr:uncharacterized protein LOC106398556 [Brassica napus]
MGGPRRSEASFIPFADMLECCEMEEFTSKGNKFTWEGTRWKKRIQCCLDRSFGNKAWLSLFPNSNQTFLEKRGSDHRPVWLNLSAAQSGFKGQFRFDKRLLINPEVKGLIDKVWRRTGSNCNLKVSQKISRCRTVLSRWKRTNQTNAKVKILKLQERMEWFQSKPYPCRFMIEGIHRELVGAYKEEEMFWKQKSKDKWLVFGDRSSKFFHGSVKMRRSKNQVLKLKDKEGLEQWTDEAKAEIAIEYFNELFKSTNTNSYDPVFEDFVPKVTTSMNVDLLRAVSKEEVKDAIFSINADSAPGPDGMTGAFFQKYWDIIGEQVTNEICEVFAQGALPQEWNLTYLCLLPKIPNPEHMSDLRPISLCSILYKTVSKILVRRIQPLLPTIVSVNQSAFVSDRVISDNIVIAHEAVHALKVHPKIAQEYMAVKTDMSKAYDRVEWSYLRSLLRALGFDERVVVWLMMCVTSVTFSVLVNDQPYGLISPQRGIRQGDPLSPFLFVLCTEGLTHLLNVVERNGLLNGLRFSEDGPSIHHLLFADDSLFMCKAYLAQATVLHRVLEFYGEATGQCINLLKSSISFGDKVDVQTRLLVREIMGIENEGGASKYLGLPECFSGSKVELFSYLKDRTQARLDLWYLQHLSQGGKEILLKSTAGAIPVSAMGCFKLPKTILSKLATMMANYWWSSEPHHRKMHWISWDKMCLPKSLGGMGFKDLECFNQAMLAKQAEKILNNPHCLLARFLKSIYFVDGDFLSAPLGVRSSYAWRSLLFGRDLLQKGLKLRVGNGQRTRVWLDKWVEDPIVGLRAPWIKNNTFDVNLRAEYLIDFEERIWNQHKLRELFVQGDVDIISRCQPVCHRDDFFTWNYNKNGRISVKSAYWLASMEKFKIHHSRSFELPSLNGLKESCWRVQTTPKIKVFLWKAMSEALSVAELINARGMHVDARCQACGEEPETINHVLFTCHVARQVWALSSIPNTRKGFHEFSVYANLNFLLNLKSYGNGPLRLWRSWPWIVWNLWKRRNELLFRGRGFSLEEVVKKAENETEEWLLAQIMEKEWSVSEKVNKAVDGSKWTPPPSGWLCCNVGVDWSKRDGQGGGGWVLRNERGVVILHSRRAFSGLFNKDEANFEILKWVVESMRSHRISNVIISGDLEAMFGAISRPDAWPSFLFYVGEIERELVGTSGIIFQKVSREENRGAMLIAQSVTRKGLTQSYVSSGHPNWLYEFFVNESRHI